MRPLLPPLSRTSKPLVHKFQVPGGPGDKIFCDDPLIFVGFTSWSLLEVTFLAPRSLNGFYFFLTIVYPWLTHCVPVSDG
jgi:hypothetical protein